MIPLIIINFSSKSTEAAIKYFLRQAIASLIFITAGVSIISTNKINYTEITRIIFIIALIIKSGIPPFHFWFPQVIDLTYWVQCFIILTWQKIAPFVIISFIFHNSIFFYIFISCLIGVIGGFNQNFIKKILTYSSIVHSAWIISTIIINFNVWIIYFFIYRIISFSIIFLAYFISIESIKKFIVINNKIRFKVIFLFNIISLGGLPPFLGFLAKFLSARILISERFRWIILITLIISSLMALFFYCKIIYISIIIQSIKISFFRKNINKKIIFFVAYSSIFLNLMSAPLVLLI